MPTIELTEAAAAEAKSYIEDNKEKYLRIGVKGGGCSGFQYTLGFDDSKDEFDQVSIKEWQPQDLEMICDTKSFLYLNNTTIDFDETLLGRGFKFVNPQASTSCGCGESFGV